MTEESEDRPQIDFSEYTRRILDEYTQKLQSKVQVQA